MKIIGLTALILLNVASFAMAQGQGDVSGNSVGNGKYLSFNDRVGCDTRGRNSATRCLPKKELDWQKREIAKWKSAIRKAVDMLPREFFGKVGTVSWRFFINRDDWTTAYAGFPIKINLLSDYENPPEWMTWESLRKNGLSEVERIFVALHEMAHIYSFGYELDALDEKHAEYQTWAQWDWNKNTKQFILSSGIKENYVVVAKESEVTLYGKARGRVEDFAETFAMYVMYPEYLKENFPKQYEIIKGILVVEYESVFPMHISLILSSIKSRLIVGTDGKK